MKKDGYGTPPNNAIPLNDRPPGELAPIAFLQLKPFQEAAIQWPIHEVIRYDADDSKRKTMVCRLCDQAIWFLVDEEGHPFTYIYDVDIKPLIVAHIRQLHSERVLINEAGVFQGLDLDYDTSPNGGSDGYAH